MSWKWQFTKKSEAQFKKLDKTVRSRVVEKLNFWVESDKPLYFAETLTEFEFGMYRFRVGDYRLVFDVEGEFITIILIGHRRSIYK